jgi:hypothetical protein
MDVVIVETLEEEIPASFLLFFLTYYYSNNTCINFYAICSVDQLLLFKLIVHLVQTATKYLLTSSTGDVSVYIFLQSIIEMLHLDISVSFF